MYRFREGRFQLAETLVLLALSGTCCSVLVASVPTGPVELTPTDLIGRLGQSSLAIDVTGDCRVSELDIILNAIAATQSVSDADGDGAHEFFGGARRATRSFGHDRAVAERAARRFAPTRSN